MQQLIQHCDENTLIPDFQSAYRKDDSMEMTLQKLVNDGLCCIERQSILAVEMLDLSAAFDTVDHELFLSVMQSNCGIRDVALKWFNKCLRPRGMKVEVKGSYSTVKSLNYSMLQGSCASANFFTAYCSPISDIVPSTMTLNDFADDHLVRQCFKANNCDQELNTINALESTMEDISNWMGMMRLKLNNDKTEFIMFGCSTQLSKCVTESFNADGVPIKPS